MECGILSGLGPTSVRVNGINADRIRSSLLEDEFIKERAKARHMADAFVALALVAGLL